MSSVTKQSINAAYENLQGKAVTPVNIFRSGAISQDTNSDVQICSLMGDGKTGTNSFKDHGAYVKLKNLILESKGKREFSFAVASEGNHAPAVVNAARLLEEELGVKIRIKLFVPRTIASVKEDNIKGLMTENDEFYKDFQDFKAAIAVAKSCGSEFISGYDDPDIISGAASTLVAVLKALGHIDRLYCSSGGGGLSGGASELFVGTETDFYCSELAHISSAVISLLKGRVQKIDRANPQATTFLLKENIDIIADGITLPTLGDLPFELLKKNKIHVSTATVDQIAVAFAYYIDAEKIDISDAGKLGAGVPELACMPALVDLLRRSYQSPEQVAGKTQVLVISGGNIDAKKAKEVYAAGKQIIEAGELRACIAEPTPFYDPSLLKLSQYSLESPCSRHLLEEGITFP